jgi:hypothetical protein
MGIINTYASRRKNMHQFSELIQYSTAFTLNALEEAHQIAIDGLQNTSATPLIKALQSVELQKAISVVGMFSIFDAILQDELQCTDGFAKAAKLLEAKGEVSLGERFSDAQLAINVLKHGRGRSYEALVKKANFLPFRVKMPGEAFFYEGDVAEVSTLIQANDAFVLFCAKVIYDVSLAIKK